MFLSLGVMNSAKWCPEKWRFERWSFEEVYVLKCGLLSTGSGFVGVTFRVVASIISLEIASH